MELYNFLFFLKAQPRTIAPIFPLSPATSLQPTPATLTDFTRGAPVLTPAMPLHPINVPIRTPADILHRSSRPQGHSTYLPLKRDWRYATGVYQHADFAESREDQTIWDMFDEDVCEGGRRRPRRNTKAQRGERMQLSESAEGGAGNQTRTVRKNIAQASRPTSIKLFATVRPSDSSAAGMAEQYEPTALVVHLRLPPLSPPTSRLENRFTTPALQTALSANDDSTSVGTPSSIDTVFTNSTFGFSTRNTSNTDGTTPLTLISATPPPPVPLKSCNHTSPYKRPWTDNTYTPSLSLHPINLSTANHSQPTLPPHWTLFRSAVTIGTLFPPGVPLSAQEILAYYPNHILWDGVARRLAGNGYTCEDILGMIKFFRPGVKDSVNREGVQMFLKRFDMLSGTKSAKGFKVKSMADLRTDTFSTAPLPPSAPLTCPTFTALVTSLEHLPSGLACRDFTACLAWWLQHRNEFTPPLEFNVLHARALSQALRIPVRSCGRRNLDKVALGEWRVGGDRFDERPVAELVNDEGHRKAKEATTDNIGEERRGHKGNKLAVNMESGVIKPCVELRLRHVLTFPFLAMLSLSGEALKMGIDKAVARKADRERKHLKRV